MIHRCKVQCHTIHPQDMERMGITEDEVKWMPFVFSMHIIDAAKIASDEHDSDSYNCTTIYTTHGETYIIDTPYNEFFEKFEEYNNSDIPPGFYKLGGEDNDVNL